MFRKVLLYCRERKKQKLSIYHHVFISPKLSFFSIFTFFQIWAFSLRNILLWTEKEALAQFFMLITNKLNTKWLQKKYTFALQLHMVGYHMENFSNTTHNLWYFILYKPITLKKTLLYIFRIIKRNCVILIML